MNRLPAIALAAAVASLPAQDGPPTFVALPDPLVAMRAEAVPELLAAWPKTRLAALHADDEVASAVSKALGSVRAHAERSRAILEAAAKFELPLEPWHVAHLFQEPDSWLLIEHALSEVRRVEMVTAFDVEGKDADSPMPNPQSALVLSCLPQFEGRWAADFERTAQWLTRLPWFRAQPDGKVAGYPAHVFVPAQDLDDSDYEVGPLQRWMLHLPGTFVHGSGGIAATGRIAGTPEPAAAGVSMTVNLDAYVRMFERLGFGPPGEFRVLGLDGLRRLQWRARFVDELVLDELELELRDAPRGVMRALLGGSAPLPPQALPEGAIVQLRAAVDLPQLVETVVEAAGSELPTIPDEQKQQFVAALDGGIALGLCAPAPGALIPRMYLSLGVRDQEALTSLLDTLLEGRAKTVTYGDVEARVLDLPDVPQGIQPAICVVDGVLHVAESGLSLRAFLKARADGATAMDVGDAPLPPGHGDPLPNFDLRFDEVALYRAYRDVWLPLYSLAEGSLAQPSVLSRDDLPSVDVVAEHCGRSRGVLRRDGERYVVQHLGPLGGPELAALAMAWGPILSASMYDWSTEQLGTQIARLELERAWIALDAFRKREQRWPNDLAELFDAEKLAPDALLLPADDLAEPVRLADGSTVRCSFRYFRTPVHMADVDGTNGMLLVEIRPRSHGRAMLTESGHLPDVFSARSWAPIDSFGK